MTARVFNSNSNRSSSSHKLDDEIILDGVGVPKSSRRTSRRDSAMTSERESSSRRASSRVSRQESEVTSERRRSVPPRGVGQQLPTSRSSNRRHSSHPSRHSSSGNSIGSFIPPPPPRKVREETRPSLASGDASQNTDSTYPSTEGHNSGTNNRPSTGRSLDEIDEQPQEPQPPRSQSSMRRRSQSVGRGEQQRSQRSASRGRFGESGRSESRSRYSTENNHRSESRSRYSGRSESRSRYDNGRSESRSSRYNRRSESRSRYESGRSSDGRSPDNRFENGRSASRSRYDTNGRSSSRMSRRSESRSRRSSKMEDASSPQGRRCYRQVDHKDVGNLDVSESGDRRSMSRQHSRLDDNGSSPLRSSNSRRRRSESRSRASSRTPQEPSQDYTNYRQDNRQQDPPPHHEDTLLTHPTPDAVPFTPPRQSSNEINLVIDSAGHGTFHIATKGLCNTNSKKSQSHLTFDIQIDESSQRYFIHTSMGRLDKIRDIHPGMNILRTLSYWNNLQKRRYGMNPTEVVRGGQLGIVAKNRTNLVTMTLMGEYSHRAWEYDDVFQRELERFVEDALQFHLCLNGDGKGGEQQQKEGSAGLSSAEKMRSPDSAIYYGGSSNKSASSNTSGGQLSSIRSSDINGSAVSDRYYVAEDPPPSSNHKRGRSKLLGKVLQKVIH